MKIEINGIAYDIVGVVNRTELATAVELLKSAGFGLKTLSERLEGMKLDSMVDIFEDAAKLEAYVAFLWIARRNAGEAISLEDASHVRIESIRWVSDDDPAPAKEASDPKAPADSEADEGPAAPE